MIFSSAIWKVEKGQKKIPTLRYSLRTCRDILPPDASCEERAKNCILTSKWLLLTKPRWDPCSTNGKATFHFSRKILFLVKKINCKRHKRKDSFCWCCWPSIKSRRWPIDHLSGEHKSHSLAYHRLLVFIRTIRTCSTTTANSPFLCRGWTWGSLGASYCLLLQCRSAFQLLHYSTLCKNHVPWYHIFISLLNRVFHFNTALYWFQHTDEQQTYSSILHRSLTREGYSFT